MKRYHFLQLFILVSLIIGGLTACGETESASDIDGQASNVVESEAEAVEDPEGATEVEASTEVPEASEPTESPAFDPTLLEGVTYSVISEDIQPGIKRSLEIQLEERLTEEVLEALALSLKSEDGAAYERTFIGYYLPDMEVGAGAWATSHFEPELEVRILGATAEEYEAMAAESVEDSNREIVGRWLDDQAFVNEQILIYRESGKTFVEFSYDDGSSRITEYIETPVDGGIRFEDIAGSDFGDHYLLTTSGELELRDSDGLIHVVTRLDE